jgi:flagellum-specific peptidoglycan hydrolase FlgJ
MKFYLTITMILFPMFLVAKTQITKDSLIQDSLRNLNDFFVILDDLEVAKEEGSELIIPQRKLSHYHNKAFAYVERYHHVAVAEMEKFGIPASITLAQALIESGFGKSEMAKRINNHFGIKCTVYQRRQKGKCHIFADDTKYDRFVKFESVWAGYRAQSLVLKYTRYQLLYDLDITNYEGWALGLQAAGYASDKNYAKKIIRIIELYELYEYDE